MKTYKELRESKRHRVLEKSESQRIKHISEKIIKKSNIIHNDLMKIFLENLLEGIYRKSNRDFSELIYSVEDNKFNLILQDISDLIPNEERKDFEKYLKLLKLNPNEYSKG